jgi:hypothetical protein
LDAVRHPLGTAPIEPLPVDQVHSTLHNSLFFGLLPDLSYVTIRIEVTWCVRTNKTYFH